MNEQVNIDNGLLLFKDSPQNVSILTTYDRKVWGNMNPYYSQTEDDKARITVNDHKLSDRLETKLSFVFTTPPEDTIIHLNKETISYLDHINKEDDQGYKYILTRTNAAIIDQYESSVAAIVAPADCAVATVVFPNSTTTIVMHLGFPQIFQGLHIKTLKFAQSTNTSLDLSKAKIFLTPYICKNHYSISSKKMDLFKERYGNTERFDTYVRKGTNPNFEGDRFYVDFMSLAKEEIKTAFGIVDFIETGLCTYEESLKGNLFSYELTQELEEQESPDLQSQKGNFNVLVGIKGNK